MKKGFTLIELLVTVSIVGLIASVALANLQSARQKAREGAGRQFHTTVRSGLGDRIVSRWELNNTLEPPTSDGGTSGGSTIIQTGPTVLDSSGSELNGYRSGEVVTVPDGIDGNAARFSGDGGFLWGENFPGSGPGGEFTVSAWIKPEYTSGNRTIFSVQNGGNGLCVNPLAVGISNGRGYVNGIETTGNILVSGEWQNLVYTFRNDPVDGHVVDTYLNGVKISSTPGMNPLDCPGGIWGIGALIEETGGEIVGQDKYIGLIDSVNVFNGSF